jgi:signal transduction histidine kinase
MAPAKKEYVTFSVDVELMRELGERLVGKPYIALGELVKNSYDADATRCIIQLSGDSIDVIDNGNGMERREFVNRWMRIGSTHKKAQIVSPKLSRPLTGSKGIGRLSAQFLGSEIEVLTIPREAGATGAFTEISWEEAYKEKSLVDVGAWISAPTAAQIKSLGFAHGTRITIRGLKNSWQGQLLSDLAGELWFLQPPPAISKALKGAKRFEVQLRGFDQNDIDAFETQTTAALSNWIAKIQGFVSNGRSGGKATVQLTFRDGKTFKESYDLPNRALDAATFEILVFKLAGRQSAGIGVKEARDYFRKFGGMHIYDSGFRLPFYGGGEQDWLNIETAHAHRLIQSKLLPDSLREKGATLRDLPTLGRVFGLVSVSTAREASTAKKGTPLNKILTVQITRDRLLSNHAYEDLVHLVRWAFDFYSYKSTLERAIAAIKPIPGTVADIDASLESVRDRVLELKEKVPPQLVEPLDDALDQFEEADQLRRQRADSERVLLGALATAGMGAVALQHELAKELVALEDVVRNLEREVLKEEIPEIAEAAKLLREWHKTATQSRRMFSPLFEADDRDRMQRLRARRVIDKVASNLKPLMRGVEVDTSDVEPEVRLPRGTFAGWSAVFQNILVNSVNATIDSRIRKVRCRTVSSTKGKSRLIIEDTGAGVDVANSDSLFEPFVRKLEIPEERKALGLGGMGIGLTIVRMVCQTFSCDARFINPRSPFSTALEISWESESE